MTAEATTEKARVGAPSIAGFTEEGEHLVASKVDRHHSHGTQVMASRAERLTSHDVADFALPNGREEEWRFTPVRELANLLSDTPSEAGALGVTVEAPAAVVQRTLRAGEAPRGATLVPADRAAVVASANAGDAQLISIPANAELDEPVRLVLTGNGAGRRTNSHVVIEAGVNSRSVVIIEHDGTSDHNGNVEVLVREGAHLTVVSLQLWGDDAKHLAQHDAEVAKDAVYKHIAVTLGGKIVRLNSNVRFAGEGAETQLLGLYYADAGQHLEHRSFVDHNVANCKSNVLYKGALQGKGAHTVWVGDVLIQKQAEGTDSYEKNQNLVLTDGCRADSVPNLEIETGLIEGAGHASATGRFDDEHLFYLMARGIPEDVARRLVVRGFLNEIIQQIKVPALEERLTDAVERELAAIDY
ncbi:MULTISPECIES: Fe-S cluster assembly protein SufD [unclassified Arthrobacter]|jgi:Fe-S cluster assembly protein SufD|uniref:Fe-S cluster assembly protein SufD n=1 Tax=Micrococcaceae TaxID=1268 RepID=UPI000363531A|nr:MULTISPECIES: Fe-S cluster assembly protein SufD [unclassified Arthrobacter]KRE73139.1 ABC transporter permease [Arthrobacter sp. Soil761]TWD56260.1 iron-regulated ABC transporter permease protein SufD [Arthrobacter sp. AG367]BCW54561.1 Fe-S cluster assembly protein SufD [Arthrobacter sp. StoSoilB19]BCW75612.1 Fe-S cluster assembly protein SufD [Arthrobacter sp. NicSoilB11]